MKSASEVPYLANLFTPRSAEASICRTTLGLSQGPEPCPVKSTSTQIQYLPHFLRENHTVALPRGSKIPLKDTTNTSRS